MKKYLIIFMTMAASLTSAAAFSQIIDSLRILPENPTTADNISLIIYATHTSGDCNLAQSSVSFSNDSVLVSASYELGMLTVICHSQDTVSLGQFNAGTYQLELMTSNTQGIMLGDTADTFFTVTGQNTGIEYPGEENLIAVFPNPVSDRLYINVSSGDITVTGISILSLSGKKVFSATGPAAGNQLPVQLLEKGMYLLEIQLSGGKTCYRKFIKQ